MTLICNFLTYFCIVSNKELYQSQIIALRPPNIGT